MKYVSTTELSKKWNISSRRIGTLCAKGRIPDVQRIGRVWMIPCDAEKTSNDVLRPGNISRERDQIMVEKHNTERKALNA